MRGRERRREDDWTKGKQRRTEGKERGSRLPEAQQETRSEEDVRRDEGLRLANQKTRCPGWSLRPLSPDMPADGN